MFLLSCEDRISRLDPNFSVKDNNLYYYGNLYSGVVQEQLIVANSVRETRYLDGRLWGVQEEFQSDSNVLLARRYFINGQKVGKHEGWFANGARRFHYEYKNDKPHGEFWEWYQSGQPSLFAKYENGVTLEEKMWLETAGLVVNK